MIDSVYYTIADVLEYIEETEPALGFDDDILNPNPERIKLLHLKELYQYYSFVTPCRKAVDELNKIIAATDTLDCEQVRVWVEENILFFKSNILSFGINFTDTNNEHDENFFLTQHNLYIERKPFVPIIQYWYLMKNLYFNQYHLVKEERKFEEPNPNDYYYVEDDKTYASNLDVVKKILSTT
ncbi:MAG: hypothetical protein JSR12_11545 [Bacteroidetes bacterium]|nr:hypothetical protein [Bacteroidota bacterium]